MIYDDMPTVLIFTLNQFLQHCGTLGEILLR
jgi:hypothetical protein